MREFAHYFLVFWQIENPGKVIIDIVIYILKLLVYIF